MKGHRGQILMAVQCHRESIFTFYKTRFSQQTGSLKDYIIETTIAQNFVLLTLFCMYLDDLCLLVGNYLEEKLGNSIKKL